MGPMCGPLGGDTPGSTFKNQHGNHRARLNVGTYDTKEEAQEAIRKARRILEEHGYYDEYAGLNTNEKPENPTPTHTNAMG